MASHALGGSSVNALQAQVRLSRRHYFQVAAGSLLATMTGNRPVFGSRPLRLLVPFPPGGAVDVAARLLAKHLAVATNTACIVENRPGAEGAVAVAELERQSDERNLIVANVANIRHLVRVEGSRNPAPTPIYLFAAQPYAILLSNRWEAVTSLADIQPVKGRAVLYGVPGLAAGKIAQRILATTNLETIPVPYPGSHQAMIALIRGEIDFLIDPIGTAINYVSSGSVRAFAVTSKSRSNLIGNISTCSELNLPCEHLESWYAVFGKSNLSANAREVIVNAIANTTQRESFLNDIKRNSMLGRSLIGDELALFLQNQHNIFVGPST